MRRKRYDYGGASYLELPDPTQIMRDANYKRNMEDDALRSSWWYQGLNTLGNSMISTGIGMMSSGVGDMLKQKAVQRGLNIGKPTDGEGIKSLSSTGINALGTLGQIGLNKALYADGGYVSKDTARYNKIRENVDKIRNTGFRRVNTAEDADRLISWAEGLTDRVANTARRLNLPTSIGEAYDQLRRADSTIIANIGEAIRSIPAALRKLDSIDKARSAGLEKLRKYLQDQEKHNSKKKPIDLAKERQQNEELTRYMQDKYLPHIDHTAASVLEGLKAPWRDKYPTWKDYLAHGSGYFTDRNGKQLKARIHKVGDEEYIVPIDDRGRDVKDYTWHQEALEEAKKKDRERQFQQEMQDRSDDIDRRVLQEYENIVNHGAEDLYNDMSQGNDWGTQPYDDIDNRDSDQHTYNQYATGGLVPIEAEGGEMIQQPQDTMAQPIQGASHEEGGVDMDVPEGSIIYSKRVKDARGLSMAERKARRDRMEQRLLRKIAENPGDKLLRDTYERTVHNNKIEDASDIALMRKIHATQEQVKEDRALLKDYGKAPLPLLSEGQGQQPQYDTGGVVREKYQVKGTVTDPNSNAAEVPGVSADNKVNVVNSVNTDWEKAYYVDDNGKEYVLWGANKEKLPIFTKNNYKYYVTKEGITLPAGIIPTQQQYSIMLKNRGISKETALDKTVRGFNTAGKLIKEYGSKSPLSLSNMLTLGGTLYNSFVPLKTAKENFAGKAQYENYYQNYGKRGVDTMNKTFDTYRAARDNNLRNLQYSQDRQFYDIDNNSRDINISNAMKLAALSNINRERSNIYTDYANRIGAQYNALAGQYNNMDSVVMGGHKEQDINNRALRDAYYNAIGSGKMAVGAGMQQTGKLLNSMEENRMYRDMINKFNNGNVDMGNLIALFNKVMEGYFNKNKGATKQSKQVDTTPKPVKTG